MRTVIATKDNGIVGKLMDKAFTLTDQLEAQNILEVGWQTNNMVMVGKNGLTALFLKEVFFRVRRVGRELSSGPMVAAMSGTSLRIISTDLEFTFGATNASLKDNGQTTKWKVTVYSHGQTSASTRVNMSTI